MCPKCVRGMFLPVAQAGFFAVCPECVTRVSGRFFLWNCAVWRVSLCVPLCLADVSRMCRGMKVGASFSSLYDNHVFGSLLKTISVVLFLYR